MIEALVRLSAVGVLWILAIIYLMLIGKLQIFWDAASWFGVLIPAVVITFGCHGWALISPGKQDLRKGVVSTFVKATVASGSFGFIAGLIVVCAHGEGLDVMGPGLAVASLSLLYAAAISMTALVFDQY